MPGQKFGPAWFPGLIGVGFGICGALLVIAGVRQGPPWLVLPDWIRCRRPFLGVTGALGGLAFYIVVADTLGFHITGVALLAFWVRVLGGSWRAAALVSVVATVAIHLSFYKLLRIPLPWGLLERWAF